MKRIKTTIILILACILLASILPAYAESEKAQKLTDRCTFDFGAYKNASTRILREESYYQIFDAGDSFSLSWEEPFEGARLCLNWQEPSEGVRILQYPCPIGQHVVNDRPVHGLLNRPMLL